MFSDTSLEGGQDRVEAHWLRNGRRWRLNTYLSGPTLCAAGLPARLEAIAAEIQGQELDAQRYLSPR